jgi:hypothetical protein
MDGSDIVKREEQILTGVAEKIGATLGSAAASAETMSKRLTTAAAEMGKAYRASMRGAAGRKRTAPKSRAKSSARRASARVKRAAAKTRSTAGRRVRVATSAPRKSRKSATRKSARRSRARR